LNETLRRADRGACVYTLKALGGSETFGGGKPSRGNSRGAEVLRGRK